jgi:PadR family transcriptional regulator
MAALTEPEPHDGAHSDLELFRDLLLGFMKVHVLHHASVEPIYGTGISAKLESRGYRISSGRLYPLLHKLDAAGFLQQEARVVDGTVRKYYRTTPLGLRALDDARRKTVALVDEISADNSEPVSSAGVLEGGTRGLTRGAVQMEVTKA